MKVPGCDTTQHQVGFICKTQKSETANIVRRHRAECWPTDPNRMLNKGMA